MVKRAEEPEPFSKEYARAVRRGISVVEPAAQRARYDAKTDRVVLELRSGIALAIPSALIQGLAEATRSARREVVVTGGGVGLYWPTLDLDIDVRGLVAGIFGSATWMSALARLAGSTTSPAKAKAARENGRRGGRPRKVHGERRAG